MKIHEYQAKALLSEFGIPVPEGGVAATPAEAKKIAAELGGKVVIKAQVYAGGRGKAGGIKVANTPEEAGKLAGEILGTRLVTHQTTPEGVPVSKVLVEKAVDVKRELYLSIIVDNASRMPVMMASEAGGMDIEEVARTSPEKILEVYVDQAADFQAFQGRKLGYGMNLSPAQVRPATSLMTNLYKLFQAKDCSLAEINPLVVTVDGELLAPPLSEVEFRLLETLYRQAAEIVPPEILIRAVWPSHAWAPDETTYDVSKPNLRRLIARLRNRLPGERARFIKERARVWLLAENQIELKKVQNTTNEHRDKRSSRHWWPSP